MECDYGDLRRDEAVALIPPGAQRLLDVGCFRGGFGSALAGRGIEVWGIEPDREAASIAATRLARVIQGRFPDDMPEGEEFDCITFLDVLEHTYDPVAVLREARRFLTPEGRVVASLPNIRHVTVVADLVRRGRWDYRESGLLDWTHIRFFTRATMLELFEKAGLLVERCEPITRTQPAGRLRVLRLMGRRNEEFLTIQYGLVGGFRPPTTSM